MAKVIIGLSGGVDSAVAAYLLQKEGYDVEGVTLRTWEAENGIESRCCEIDDAHRVAMKLGIRYHAPNCMDLFKECVTDPFMQDYVNGLTPNPCVVCNRYVKWERMLYEAKVLSADYVATGHYAQIMRLDNGRYTVMTATHAEKDQTYMLWMLTQEELGRTLMPLWPYSKSEVREIAKKIGLSVADKKDSQEICFVPDGHYSEYIEKHYEGNLDLTGNFVDEEGNILGPHLGIIHYTVGQRKGLGLPLGYPAYVKEIRANTREVVISTEDSLFSNDVYCKNVNFLSIEDLKSGDELRCLVKIRYHHKAQEAVLMRVGDDLVRIHFDKPVKAATPGQSAVFYHESGYVIGGGFITRP